MKLSVMMITYNHERFVAQAVESALGQQTGFEYEIVIGEDCSTDRTREIVTALATRHPGRVRLLAREHNLGIAPNFIHTIRECRGEYVAVLEGDDYWTSPHKLQRQVDYLDAHPECAACYHRARVVYEDGRPGFTYPPPGQPAFSTLEDLLAGNFMPSCSVVFRRALVGELPPGFERLPMGDWPLHLLNARFGALGFLDQTMGVYRVHPGGAWTPADPARRLESEIAVLETVGPYLPLRVGEALRAALAARREKLALAARPPAVEARPLQPRRPGERYRVAFYAPEAALPAGPESPPLPEASALAALAAALAGRGHEVVIYADDRPLRADDRPLRADDRPPRADDRPPRADGAPIRLAAEAPQADCDVLICTSPALPSGARAGLRLLWTRAPVTAAEAAPFDYLYAASAALANDLRQAPGIPSLKLFTAPDGCPPPPPATPERDLFLVECLCHAPEHAAQAARIAADLRAHDPRFRVRLSPSPERGIASEPRAPEPRAPEPRASARGQSGQPPAFLLTPAQIPRPESAALLAAKHAGAIVLAPAAGGNPEVIFTEYDGFLFEEPFESPEFRRRCVDRILALAADPALARAVSARARGSLPTWESVAGDWLAHWERAFAGHEPTGGTPPPRVSVILAAHNAAATLRGAVDSILSQTLRNIELIVVNDGSTDQTGAVLRGYDDPRLLVIDQPNRGLPAALNRALSVARGEFIARMDADDLTHPRRLQVQLAVMDRTPRLGLLGSAVHKIDAAGRVQMLFQHPLSDAEIVAGMRTLSRFIHPTVMLRRAVLARAGAYRPREAEDYDLFLRICERYEVRNLPEPWHQLRRTEGTRIARSGREIHQSMLDSTQEALERYLQGRDWSGGPLRLRWRERRPYARLLYHWAAACTEAERSHARRLLLRAVALWPPAPRHWAALLRLRPALLSLPGRLAAILYRRLAALRQGGQ